MISIEIKGHTVKYPKDMFVTLNEDKNILVAIDRKEKEIHCILDFSQNDILIENGWNIKYRINGKDIVLEHNFSEN